MSLIQHNVTNTLSGDASSALTTPFNTLPIAGEMLVAVLTVDKDASSVTTIPGFTAPVIVKSGASITLAYSYKVSDGTEASLTQAWVSTGAGAGLWVGALDPVPGGVIDVAANFSTSGFTAVSLSTGTTPSTTRAGLAIALWASDTWNNVDGGRAYTNGFSEVFFNTPTAGAGSAGLAVATKTVVVEAVESTYTTTDPGDQMAAAMLVFGTVDIEFYLSNSEATNAIVKCRIPSGLSSQLEYSTNADFSNSSTTAAVVPAISNDYIASFSLAGLTSSTQYYYRAIEDGAADTRNGKFKTAIAAGDIGTIKYVFSGDAASSNNSQTFAAIAALTDIDKVLHQGDMHYNNIAVNTEGAYFTAFKTVFSQSNQRAMYESHSLKYIWDDHDYGVNDAVGSNPTKISAAGAYRKYIPNANLNNPSTGSIERAWTEGRTRFIMLDVRYEANASTRLGAAQKSWLFSELSAIAASPSIKFTVVSVGVPWIVNAPAADNWSAVAAERTEISDKIFELELEHNIVFICADAHMITHDVGMNNTYSTLGRRGWPLYHSAPFGQFGSNKGGPYSGTVFQGDTDGQYSTMEIIDTGQYLSITVVGIDKNGSTLYTHAFVIGDIQLNVPLDIAITPTAGILTSYDRNTEATYTDGAGEIQTALANVERIPNIDGLLIEPLRVNKCTSPNAVVHTTTIPMGNAAAFNAAGVVGVVATENGGTGCLFGIIDRTSELTTDGYIGVATTGLVLAIDNSAGSGSSYFTHDGTVNNLNPHCHSVVAKLVLGAPVFYLNVDRVTDGSVITSPFFRRFESDNIVPLLTTRPVRMWCSTGEAAEYLLPQLEEGAFSTTTIISIGGAATRAADDLIYAWPTALANDYILEVIVKPTAANQGEVCLWSVGAFASNYVSLWHTGTAFEFRVRTGGVDYVASFTSAMTNGTTYTIECSASSSSGLGIIVNAVAGSGNVSTADVLPANLTLRTGSAEGGTDYFTGQFSLLRVDVPGGGSDQGAVLQPVLRAVLRPVLRRV